MAKKAKKFEVGDRIGIDTDRYNQDEDLCFGTISRVLTDDKVMVNWDDSWMSNDHPTSIEDLLHEDELQKKYSALEEKFQAVEEKVKGNIKTAAKALLAAQKIAYAAGLDLSELYDAVAPLENAMDQCGWSTSSLHC